jgi:hypothetical protein
VQNFTKDYSEISTFENTFTCDKHPVDNTFVISLFTDLFKEAVSTGYIKYLRNERMIRTGGFETMWITVAVTYFKLSWTSL